MRISDWSSDVCSSDLYWPQSDAEDDQNGEAAAARVSAAQAPSTARACTCRHARSRLRDTALTARRNPAIDRTLPDVVVRRAGCPVPDIAVDSRECLPAPARGRLRDPARILRQAADRQSAARVWGRAGTSR